MIIYVLNTELNLKLHKLYRQDIFKYLAALAVHSFLHQDV